MLNTAKKSRLLCRHEHGAPKALSVFLITGLFCLTAATNTVSAATYYLDATNGDDSNPGTSAQPWKTLNRAYTSYAGADPKVREGDTVYLKDGNYGTFRESTDDGGTYHVHRTDWITYRAADGHEPNLTSVFIKNYGGVAHYGESYLVFDGLTIADGMQVWYSNYIKILNCTVTMLPLSLEGFYAPYFMFNDDYAVYFREVNDINVEDCNISNAYQGISIRGPSERVVITNNEIHLIAADCLSISATRNLLIDNNYMYDIDCRRTAITISGTQSGAWSPGEVLNQAGSNASGVYDSNTATAIRAFITSEQEWVGTNTIATGLDEEGDNGTITGATSGTTLTDVGSLDPVAHSECFEIMSYNTAYNSQNVTISRNIGVRLIPAPWTQNSQASKIEAKVNAEFEDLLVENNLLVSDTRPMLLPGVSNFTLRNNTLVGGGAVRLHLTSGDPSSVIDNMYNNIFSGFVLDSDADTRYCRVINHGNNIFGDDPDGDGGPSYPFTVNGTELTNYNIDSLFVDAANNDFNLAPTSVAIDFGNSNYGPSSDILGVSRNVPPDAGCYEYISSPSDNNKLALDTIGNKSVNENSLLTFDVNATDADGDTITYSVQNLPSGATFSSPFSWTPGYSQAGSYQVTFIASDGEEQDSETITITVGNTNRAPVLAAIGNKSVNEGSLLSFSISATDPDSDTITYSAQNLPTGATFSNRTFSWTPGYDQAGSFEVTFIASDGQEQDPETITITVGNTNRTPVLAAIGNRTVNENTTLNFSISATDADSNPITYSVEDLPSGAAFASQSFIWTPGYDQAGSFEVTFNASDGQNQDSETITITVNNVNRAPVLDAIADKSVDDGTLLTFAVNATDPDGDTIEYSATGLPSGAAFSGQTFSWTPAHSQADNSYQVTFIASDGQLQDPQAINIVVSDTSAPTVTNSLPTAGSIQTPLNNLITLNITDAGKGVNAGSVTIKVNNNIVYSGNTDKHSSIYGECYRIGTKADYRFIYQPNEMFDYDQTVSITANATDLAGNAMNEHPYSFVTEMRSFGKNKNVDSRDIKKGRPVTVCDNSGNMWAAWHAGPIRGSRDIYIGKLVVDEEYFGDIINLTEGSTADQCNPVIALDSSDKLYVAWQDDRQADDNNQGEWDIYISTSVDGISWSTETRINDPNDANQVNPAIVIDGQSPNQAYVVWQDDSTGNQDIYIAASSDGFATKTVSQITTNISDQVAPAIAADSDNTIYVVWTDTRNKGKNDIYGAASNNGPWTNIPVVIEEESQSSPAIAAEAVGSILHLVWVDDRLGDDDIFYGKTIGGLSPLAGRSIIDDSNGADQISPVIVTTGYTGNDLKVFACWRDERNTDADLYCVEIGSDNETNVFVGDDGTSTDQSEPAIGIDGDGYPYLVWTNERTDICYAGSTFIESVALASTNVSISSTATVGTVWNAVNSIDDASAEVPRGAYLCDVKITISRIKNPPKSNLELDRFSGTYEFGPSGMQFIDPVTITIPYEVNGSENVSYAAYWYNTLTGTLSQEGITNVETIVISPTLHALQFKTTHFTEFLIGGGIAAAVGGGGGGGGGGCSISPAGQGNIAEFLVPYIGLAAAMVIIRLRDMRNRKARNIKKG